MTTEPHLSEMDEEFEFATGTLKLEVELASLPLWGSMQRGN